MQDFKNSTLQKRRATDCEQCIQIVKAFVVNDLGEPDFDGHRKSHAQMIEAEKVLHGYKLEATKKVVGWVVAGLLGLASSIIFSYVKDGFHQEPAPTREVKAGSQ